MCDVYVHVCDVCVCMCVMLCACSVGANGGSH